MIKRKIVLISTLFLFIFLLKSDFAFAAVDPYCLNSCHDLDDGFDDSIDGASFNLSMHRAINRTNSSVPSLNCQVCHYTALLDGSNMNVPMPTYECQNCHSNVSSPVSNTPQIAEHYNLSSDVNTTAKCEDCHENSVLGVTEYEASSKNTKANVSHYGKRPTLNTSDCTSCHFDSANATLWGGAKLINNTIMGGVAINDTATSSDCYLCHVDGGGSVDNFHVAAVKEGALPTDCATCHDNGGLGSAPHIDNSIFSSSAMMNDTNQDGVSNSSDCQTCHYTANVNGSNMATPMPTYYCTDCHVNSSSPVPGAQQVAEHYNESSDINTTAKCEDCHQNSVLSFSEDDAGTKNNKSKVSHYGTRPSLDTTACKSCHMDAANGTLWGNAIQVNGTTMSGLTVTTSTSNADCLTCHGDVSSTNFHNSILTKPSSINSTACKTCHFTSTKEATFTESVHGAQECTICKSSSSPMNRSELKRCGPNGACHNLTSSRYDFHSEKKIKCENTCHGDDYHGVGKFKQACETCHSEKKKHVKPMLKGVKPFQTNETFGCTTCHSIWHENDINEPNCNNCHDYQKLPNTGDVCEKCHGSLHTIHVTEQRKECQDCHDDFHAAPREVNCDKCHAMVKKSRPDEILIPHTDCRDCHEHLNKPTEMFPFCMNCHKTDDEGLVHGSKLMTDVHNEVTSSKKNCADCHTLGVDKKPKCTACHNVHILHKEEKTCTGCHGLLEGQRTHFTIYCDTCHKREGDKGAHLDNLLPKDISVGITKPDGCLSCHKYKRKEHVTCKRCHGETSPKDADLSTFTIISNAGTVIYNKNSIDKVAVDYLREGTALGAEDNLITMLGKHRPLYNSISLYWHDLLPFAYAGRNKINATPILNIYNVTPGLVTNDTGNQYLISEVDYPDVEMRPVIEKAITIQSGLKIVDASIKFKDNIKMTFTNTSGTAYLYIIEGKDITEPINITGINTTTDISDDVHEVSDVLDGYDVFITNVSVTSIKVAISDKSDFIKISDEQEHVLGYSKVGLSEDETTIQFNGTELTFIDGERQDIITLHEYRIILGGPSINPAAEIENSRAKILINQTENGIELVVDQEKYVCEDKMWKKEDFAVLKIMKVTDESSYIYAEGCTRFGTEAAVKMLKSGTDILKGKTTAILHWEDFNANEAVELDEIDIIFAF